MLPTYEELIEKMAEAICNSHPNTHTKWDEVVRLSGKDGYMVAKDIVKNTKIQAKAALQVLLESLPDKDLEIVGESKIYGSIYYKLLAMRKNYAK